MNSQYFFQQKAMEVMLTIFQFFTGHAVFSRETFKLIFDVISEPQQLMCLPENETSSLIACMNVLLYS